MDKVKARSIVQAGGGHALVYVDFTVVPCKDMKLKQSEFTTDLSLMNISYSVLHFPST